MQRGQRGIVENLREKLECNTKIYPIEQKEGRKEGTGFKGI